MRILVVALVCAGCSKGSSKEPPSSGAGNAPTSAGTKASAANAYEGSVKTSGLYAATWTAAPGNEPNPFNSVSNPSLTSDKQTWGNIKIEKDGKISFGSGATELGQFAGSGAKVTLDKSGAFVCAFTVDTDLVNTSDASKKVHMSGGMTVHWHPEGVGDMSCP